MNFKTVKPLEKMDSTDWETPQRIDGNPALVFAAVVIFEAPNTTGTIFRVQWRTRDLEHELETEPVEGVSPSSGLAMMREALQALAISTEQKLRDLEAR